MPNCEILWTGGNRLNPEDVAWQWNTTGNPTEQAQEITWDKWNNGQPDNLTGDQISLILWRRSGAWASDVTWYDFPDHIANHPGSYGSMAVCFVCDPVSL